MQKVTLNINYKDYWLNNLFAALFRSHHQLKLPSDWTEITPQLRKPCLQVLMNRSLDSNKTCINLLQIFVPIKKNLFFSIDPIDFLEKLIPCVEWMLNTPMIDPIIPKISFGKKVYHMPKRAFLNMSVGEYIELEKTYSTILTGDYEAVDDLLAILLRQSNTDQKQVKQFDDIRIPLDNYSREKRRELFVSLDPVYKFYATHFYIHCKQHLHDRYQLVFESDDRKNTEGGSTSWEDVLTDTSETGVFGPVSDLLKVNIHMFFTWLLKNKKRYLRQKHEELQDIIKQNHKKFLA